MTYCGLWIDCAAWQQTLWKNHKFAVFPRYCKGNLLSIPGSRTLIMHEVVSTFCAGVTGIRRLALLCLLVFSVLCSFAAASFANEERISLDEVRRLYPEAFQAIGNDVQLQSTDGIPGVVTKGASRANLATSWDVSVRRDPSQILSFGEIEPIRDLWDYCDVYFQLSGTTLMGRNGARHVDDIWNQWVRPILAQIYDRWKESAKLPGYAEFTIHFAPQGRTCETSTLIGSLEFEVQAKAFIHDIAEVPMWTVPADVKSEDVTFKISLASLPEAEESIFGEQQGAETAAAKSGDESISRNGMYALTECDRKLVARIAKSP